MAPAVGTTVADDVGGVAVVCRGRSVRMRRKAAIAATTATAVPPAATSRPRFDSPLPLVGAAAGAAAAAVGVAVPVSVMPALMVAAVEPMVPSPASARPAAAVSFFDR